MYQIRKLFKKIHVYLLLSLAYVKCNNKDSASTESFESFDGKVLCRTSTVNRMQQDIQESLSKTTKRISSTSLANLCLHAAATVFKSQSQSYSQDIVTATM